MRKLLLLFLACFAVATLDAQIYVAQVSGGQQNGSSWADAYIDLQIAIDAANAGDTIWVAKGSYKPSIDTLGNTPAMPENRSFWLKNGVVVLGGFTGNETALSQRDPFSQKATLEGEVAPGQFAEHVLYVYNNIDNTAILDGFIIQNGKSVSTSTSKNGAGMLLRGDAGFYNLHFRNNECFNSGAAIYAENTSSIFVRCRFTGNTAVTFDGGSCDFVYSDVAMYNCVYDSNHAGRFGCGMVTIETDLLVQNGTFVANTAGNNIFQFSTSGNISLNNCIFTSDNVAPNVAGNSGPTVTFRDGLIPPNNNSWGILCNTCIIVPPTFTNASTGDYSLAMGSSGIDEALITTPSNDYDDYAGNPRLIGTSMDMGAFEYQGSVAVAQSTPEQEITVYPNPATSNLALLASALIEKVEIYNLAGQLMQIENSGSFSVTQLPAGLYFLQVTTTDGLNTARFIKE